MMLGKRLSELLQNKLSTDIAWTVGSFFVLAVSGILINVIIAYFRSAADLGVFNLAYSVYIIVSQLAVLGIHYSVLRNAAHHDNERGLLGVILGSAVGPVLALGIICASIVFLAEPLFADLFDSEQAARAIALAALAIALFPLNKVLISFLNGLREMKAFAFLQAGRYILVTVVVTILALSSWSFEYAALSFLVAEVVTLVAAVAYIAARGLVTRLSLNARWVRSHVVFGSKSLVAGMFGEINTRVDVLMLGVFLSDSAVGIYSFAAMLLDGLYHLLAMVRVNFNPFLVGAIRDNEWAKAQNILRLSKLYAPLVMGVMSVGVFVFYWLVTTYIIPEKGLAAGLPSLFILLSGLVITAGLIPFDNLLLVSGHPGYQTMQQFFAVVANAAVNLAFIPLLGIEGAAIGTALSYFAGIAVLVLMANRLLAWNLLTNKRRDKPL